MSCKKSRFIQYNWADNSTWNIESQSQQNIELPIKKLVLVYMQSNYKLLKEILVKKIIIP
jgi:hypothetical protein